MKIGGLQPVTLLDYPQKVAAIIFTIGCNMRCPFCYNSSLVLSSEIKNNNPLAESDVLDFLRKRKKYLDGAVITGGEPTLQSDIVRFCRKLKKMDYLIKLDTNGLLPDVLEKLINEKLVDYIAMDIKASPDKYKKASGVIIDMEKIKKSISLVMNSGLPYEFRSTLVGGIHNKEDIIEMAKLISGADKYFLQNFKLQKKHVGKDFVGKSLTYKAMDEFCSLAKKHVKNCEAR